MRDERRTWLAAAGGICGAAYLAANQLALSIPDILMGLLLGLGAVLMMIGLLPEEARKRLRKWKRRGE